ESAAARRSVHSLPARSRSIADRIGPRPAQWKMAQRLPLRGESPAPLHVLQAASCRLSRASRRVLLGQALVVLGGELGVEAGVLTLASLGHRIANAHREIAPLGAAFLDDGVDIAFLQRRLSAFLAVAGLGI